MMKRTLITNGVVLPMYNERYRFELKNLLVLSELLDKHGYILIVDDGSEDTFADDIDEYLIKNQINNVATLRLPLNQGKANAIKVGFKELISEFPDLQYLSFADSDFSAPPSEVIRLIDVIQTNSSDVVCGSRMNIEGRVIKFDNTRHFVGRFFAYLIKILFKFNLYDSQCGYKVFRNSSELIKVLDLPTVHKWLIDIELMTRLRALNPKLRIWEEPLLVWTHKGESKIKFKEIFSLSLKLNQLFRSL